ncbi:MAG: glutamate synthase, partial [Thermoplasmata archaeon]|nr:glutamate synthase [Thermoplasmata archaeon]
MSDESSILIESRSWMRSSEASAGVHSQEAEGGCGVVGIASSVPLAGKHILGPLLQMHNRGNGKGGGIAAVGLSPEQLGVSKKVLEEDYLIQVAYLKPSVRETLEEEFIKRNYRVEKKYMVEPTKDSKFVSSLEVQPPEVWRYFCRAKKEVLADFVKKSGLGKLDPRKAEDEFVY